MSQNRTTLLLALLAVLFVTTAYGSQDECVPEEVVATSSADTIFVQHLNAYANCCLELEIAVGVTEFIVDFYETDVGEDCDCMCCFNLRYDASGFAAGHYTVRVWNENGSILHGETEVDVEGSGEFPLVGRILSGDCLDPAAVEPPETSITWGEVRAIYR
jgi:hypothetical protein